MAIDLFNDISHVKQALSIDHASMEDSGNYQIIIFNPKCYTLKEIRKETVIDFKFLGESLMNMYT